MSSAKACYDNHPKRAARNRVTYVVNATGVRLYRDFDSPYLAKQFVERVKHGTACRLISWPYFG